FICDAVTDVFQKYRPHSQARLPTPTTLGVIRPESPGAARFRQRRNLQDTVCGSRGTRVREATVARSLRCDDRHARASPSRYFGRCRPAGAAYRRSFASKCDLSVTLTHKSHCIPVLTP